MPICPKTRARKKVSAYNMAAPTGKEVMKKSYSIKFRKCFRLKTQQLRRWLY